MEELERFSILNSNPNPNPNPDTKTNIDLGAGILSTKLLMKDKAIREVIERASTCFAKGIKLDPLHSGCWNGLGLCAEDDKVSLTLNSDMVA